MFRSFQSDAGSNDLLKEEAEIEARVYNFNPE